MQPDSMTLAVDELNNGTTVDHVYNRFEVFQNRSVYVASDHTLGARDMVGMYRTFPKVSGNFKGVAKTSVKFTEDAVVDGVDGVSQITAPIIVDISFSVPVGVSPAQVLVARQRAIALLDRDDLMGPLNDQLMV